MLAALDLFKEMDSFRRDLNQLFTNFDDRSSFPHLRGGWPAANMKETEHGLELELLVPGMDPKDIGIDVKQGLLTVSGERTREAGEKNTWHRRERSYGKFSRSFKLPAEIDSAKVEASFRDGILKVRLPKAEAAKPRRIEIATAE